MRTRTMIRIFKLMLKDGPLKQHMGICGNLELMALAPEESVTEKDAELLQDMFKTWPQYSGNKFYPIPSWSYRVAGVSYPQHGSSYLQHACCRTLWEDEQLELRQSLLRHMIAELEKENGGGAK